MVKTVKKKQLSEIFITYRKQPLCRLDIFAQITIDPLYETLQSTDLRGKCKNGKRKLFSTHNYYLLLLFLANTVSSKNTELLLRIVLNNNIIIINYRFSAKRDRIFQFDFAFDLHRVYSSVLPVLLYQYINNNTL